MKRSLLRVHFDASCGAGLRCVLLDTPSLFIQTGPEEADVVVFGKDDLAAIDGSELYRAHRPKSICVTESDTPTFRLPGLYAANLKSALTASRTRTVSYFISEREQGNPDIKALRGRSFEKRFLYSFMGGSNSWPRKHLLKAVRQRPDTIVEATNSYNHWNRSAGTAEARAYQRRRYAEVMAASKFTLCPRGCGLSSYRLFESMSLGVAPVIISDPWKPIEGIDWSFALQVREREIPRLDEIVRAHASEWQQRGETARLTYQRLLAEDVVAHMIHDAITAVLSSYDPRRERYLASLLRLRADARDAYWAIRKVAKLAALWGFHLAGRSPPFTLTQPIEVQLKRPATLEPGGGRG